MANQYCECHLDSLDEIIPCGKTIDLETYKTFLRGTVTVPTGLIINNIIQEEQRKRRETKHGSGNIFVNYNYDPSNFDQALDSKNNPGIDWPTMTGITEEEAREYCNTGILESPVYLACANYTDNVEEIIAKCISDVKVVIYI